MRVYAFIIVLKGMHDFQFPAHGSSTFKAIRGKGYPAVVPVLPEIKVVICPHSLDKSPLHFVLFNKYLSYSDRYGVVSIFYGLRQSSYYFINSLMFNVIIV
jgi:hypothetical protein